VKVVADCADGLDLNTGGQLGVQCADQFFRRMLPVGIEVEALPVGMHAGVGAAAAVNLHVDCEDLRERRFDVILHSVAVRLALPTFKVRAIVSANTFPTHAKDSCQCC